MLRIENGEVYESEVRVDRNVDLGLLPLWTGTCPNEKKNSF